MMLDLDPCIEVTCGHYGYCKAMGPHHARCVCVDFCPSYQEPVCSSNGTTYDNKCLFEQEMCSMQLNFTIQHPGSCEGKINLIYIYLSLDHSLLLVINTLWLRQSYGHLYHAEEQ